MNKPATKSIPFRNEPRLKDLWNENLNLKAALKAAKIKVGRARRYMGRGLAERVIDHA